MKNHYDENVENYYEQLLKKYMEHVKSIEGTDFLGLINHEFLLDEIIDKYDFTKKDYFILQEISEEGY